MEVRLGDGKKDQARDGTGWAAALVLQAWVWVPATLMQKARPGGGGLNQHGSLDKCVWVLDPQLGVLFLGIFKWMMNDEIKFCFFVIEDIEV